MQKGGRGVLYLCFTADYELFFGKNNLSEREVMIQPTTRLIQVLESCGAPLTLFVDVLCIMKYRQEGLWHFVHESEGQIIDAVKRGHDVQLHIHPHWITSIREDGSWHYDMKKYRIHEFGFGERGYTAQTIIRDSKQYLEDIVKRVEPSYSCTSYRAGGWCIQPEKELIKALLDEGVWIDSTVYRGARLSHPHSVDFTSAPDRINWWISPESGVCVPAGYDNARMLEIPTGSYWRVPSMWMRKLRTKRVKIKNGIGMNTVRGVPADMKSKAWQRVVQKIDQFFLQPIMLNYEYSCCDEMLYIVRSYLERFDCESKDYYLSILGHPKNMFENSLLETERFCRAINRDYRGRVGFETLSGVAKMVVKERI